MKGDGKAVVAGMLLFLLSAVAPAEDCTAIAYVNISQVVQRVGYDKLYLLGADPQIREELAKLEKQRDALTKQLIAAEDQASLKEVTEQIRLIETKHGMLMRNMRSRNSREAQNWIKQFITEHYGKRYGLILTRQIENDTNVIHQSVTIENLTDKVVQDVSAALESK